MPTTATSNGQAKTVRFSLEMSEGAAARLNEMARNSSTTKSDVMRRALEFYNAALEAREQGKRVGIADQERRLETEFVSF